MKKLLSVFALVFLWCACSETDQADRVAFVKFVSLFPELKLPMSITCNSAPGNGGGFRNLPLGETIDTATARKFLGAEVNEAHVVGKLAGTENQVALLYHSSNGESDAVTLATYDRQGKLLDNEQLLYLPYAPQNSTYLSELKLSTDGKIEVVAKVNEYKEGEPVVPGNFVRAYTSTKQYSIGKEGSIAMSENREEQETLQSVATADPDALKPQDIIVRFPVAESKLLKISEKCALIFRTDSTGTVTVGDEGSYYFMQTEQGIDALKIKKLEPQQRYIEFTKKSGQKVIASANRLIGGYGVILFNGVDDPKEQDVTEFDSKVVEEFMRRDEK